LISQGPGLLTLPPSWAERVLGNQEFTMGLLRGGIAGLAAWKWGGGCFGTIIIFLLIYWLLGVLGMR
jgi:hypothetical protein